MHCKLFKKNKVKVIAFLIVVAIFVVAAPASADVSVVANKSIGEESISEKQAKKIWLGKTKSLGGVSLKPADLPKGNDSRNKFYKTVVKKNEKKLKAYWARIIFSGKGSPPKLFKSDAEVINWVASTPGAVGYVDSVSINDSVKVLLISK